MRIIRLSDIVTEETKVNYKLRTFALRDVELDKFIVEAETVLKEYREKYHWEYYGAILRRWTGFRYSYSYYLFFNIPYPTGKDWKKIYFKRRHKFRDEKLDNFFLSYWSEYSIGETDVKTLKETLREEEENEAYIEKIKIRLLQ